MFYNKYLKYKKKYNNLVGGTNQSTIQFTDKKFSQMWPDGIIAFYYPGKNEPCDDYFKAEILGNFYPTNLVLTNGFKNDPTSFLNAEAAFQALKFWSMRYSFSNITANTAIKLKNQLQNQVDFTYAGYGDNKKAMYAVLEAKFKDTIARNKLLDTKYSFLLEHNSKQDRDYIWSDNSIGNGCNGLGLQLMLLRSKIRVETGIDTPNDIQLIILCESYLNFITGRGDKQNHTVNTLYTNPNDPICDEWINLVLNSATSVNSFMLNSYVTWGKSYPVPLEGIDSYDNFIYQYYYIDNKMKQIRSYLFKKYKISLTKISVNDDTNNFKITMYFNSHIKNLEYELKNLDFNIDVTDNMVSFLPQQQQFEQQQPFQIANNPISLLDSTVWFGRNPLTRVPLLGVFSYNIFKQNHSCIIGIINKIKNILENQNIKLIAIKVNHPGKTYKVTLIFNTNIEPCAISCNSEISWLLSNMIRLHNNKILFKTNTE
jgi:predicted NAD-dependent protein-ADP-ribosyltransferase YbiA (DUF1768 family)